MPLLLNEQVSWDDELYAEYINLQTYRTKEWKLVMDFSEKGLHELYHLKEDPQEHINIYQSKAPVIVSHKQELEEKLIEKMKQIDDPLLSVFHSSGKE